MTQWDQEVLDFISNTFDTYSDIIGDAANKLTQPIPKWIGVVDFGLFSDEMLAHVDRSMKDIKKAAEREGGPKASDVLLLTVDLLKLTAEFKGLEQPGKTRATGIFFHPTRIPQSDFTTFAIYVQTLDTGVKLELPEPFGNGIFLPFSGFGWRYSHDQTITVVHDMRVYIGGIDVWNLPYPSKNSKDGFIYPGRLIVEFLIIAAALYLMSLNITVAYRAGLYLLTIFGMISTYSFRKYMKGELASFSEDLGDITQQLQDIEDAIDDLDPDALKGFDFAKAFAGLGALIQKKGTGLTAEQDAILRSIAANLVGKLHFI
jgi:hypothetical protein